MKNNYRIIFYHNRTEKRKVVDISVKNSSEAFALACKMPEAKNREYTDVFVEEIPDYPTTIGVRFEYYDTYIKRFFSDVVMIKAENEKQAVEYYEKNLRGKRFWFNAGETKEDGKCIRGKVLETYFASCPGYDADATEGGNAA